jgi:serine/threonine-protein kinase
MLSQGHHYLSYETEQGGRRGTVALLAVDCEGDAARATELGRRIRELVTLDHPTVAPVRGHGVRHGIPFVEHPPFDGRTLTEHLARGAVGRDRALAIALDLLEGLAYAHMRGFTHGELSPDDIVLVHDEHGVERPRIFGTGVAPMVRDLGGEPKAAAPGDRDRYLSPEVLAQKPWSGRADVYSVGAILYRMITDEVPPPPPVVSAFAGNPLFPADLEPLFLRSLAVDPLDRYASVEEMMIEVRDALTAKRALSSRPPAARRALATRVKRKPSQKHLAAAAVASGVVMLALALVLAFLPGAEGETRADKVAVEPKADRTVALGADAPAEPTAALPTELDVPPAFRDAPLDPLTVGVLPPELRELHLLLLDGVPVDRTDVVPLYDYVSSHPDDARPHLLMGDAFVELGWYSDAIDQYSMANELDPASRRHPLVLENLVWLTYREGVADAAAETIAEIFGRDALPAVEAAIATDPGERQTARLEALRQRLSRM